MDDIGNDEELYNRLKRIYGSTSDEVKKFEEYRKGGSSSSRLKEQFAAGFGKLGNLSNLIKQKQDHNPDDPSLGPNGEGKNENEGIKTPRDSRKAKFNEIVQIFKKYKSCFENREARRKTLGIEVEMEEPIDIRAD